MFPPSGNIVMNFEDKVTRDRAAQELDEKIPETEVRKVGYMKPKIMLCNANTYHLVFKCEPEVRKAIHENRDEIKFAFAVYHVRDRYHVRICTYCQRFGHIERNCIHKNHEPFCGKTHSFFHLPRIDRVGGGVGLFLQNSFTHIRCIKRPIFSSFEIIEVNFKYQVCNLLFIIVYRPPNLSANDFFEQFDDLLENIEQITNKVISSGDFNFWMDRELDREKVRFTDLLEAHQLRNFVQNSTSSSGHALDLIISHMEGNFVQNIEIEEKL